MEASCPVNFKKVLRRGGSHVAIDKESLKNTKKNRN